jgi:hypothetical protein
MTVVALIPTGDMEYCALAPALQQLFPDTTFILRPRERRLNGFTSRDVGPLVEITRPVPTELDELAGELVNSVLGGRRGEETDYAFVVEDLELANDHQPGLVVQVFRDAVDRFIRENWSRALDRVFARARERCSFHLFRPMTEAYFFGEPAALNRAGATRDAQLPPDLDLEQFRTTDTDFLAFPAGTDRIADMPDRERHPKSYLHYLCDPTLSDRKRRYRETRGGANALRMLDWEQVLTETPHCPFLHALLDDLGYALNQPLPFVDPQHAAAQTRYPGPQQPLLRNI